MGFVNAQSNWIAISFVQLPVRLVSKIVTAALMSLLKTIKLNVL